MKIVIIGAGEMGYHLARRLSFEKQDVTLVDRSEERVYWLTENLDVRVMHGRGSSPSVLREAGVSSASIFIAVTDSDEANLVASYVAGRLNSSLLKVARLREEDFWLYPELFNHHHFGLDLVISPEDEAVKKLFRVLQVPAATDVVNFAEERIRLFAIRLGPTSPLAGRSLMDLRKDYPLESFLVPAIFREAQCIIPRGADVLRPLDTVYFLAASDAVDRIVGICGYRPNTLKSYMILGGTTVGIKIARTLEKEGITNIRLVESDLAKCEEIAESLNHTLVLRADTVDEEFLRHEGISELDAFLAVTNNEEYNALTAVLAKRMGAKRVAALTHKAEYDYIVTAIGVDVAINPRLTGVSRILQYIRRGKVISVSTLPGEAVEIVECEAMETSDLVGRPLSKVRLPHGSLIGALERNKEFMIPNGATVIEPGDRVVIFARREVIPEIEKVVTVKLEYF